ncbi:hypothetical protein ACFLKB_00875 [Clostridium sp. FAM 1755]|uniref:hypothetical protein n=1 Tax=Clostridium TaxID=1485 RepID=UPI002904818E|nr:hypothetical protein [Clostridium botulinum]
MIYIEHQTEVQDKIQQKIFSYYGIPPELLNKDSFLKMSIKIQEKLFKEKHNCT